MSRVREGRVRAIHRLVTEVCLDGHDARLWPGRLMEGMLSLFAAKMVALAWVAIPDKLGAFARPEILLQRGFTSAEMRRWVEGYWRPENVFQSEFLRRVVNIPARFVTVLRQDVMNDSEWYASNDVQSIHRDCQVDANMSSHFAVLGKARIFAIGIHRAWGDPQFEVEQRRELRRLHLELARVWQRRIATPEGASQAIQELPFRLRQVLWMLFQGRVEKEIAQELHLSLHTVHNHVRRLYKRLNVNSRSELLAQVHGLDRGNAASPVTIPPNDSNEFEP